MNPAIPRNRCCVQQGTMRSTAWIWFVGCAAWIVDGIISVDYRAWLHARIAFTIAILFLAAGIFYRAQKR